MKNKRGFTLLELLIVVVIVGILASLAIPRYQKSVESGRAAEAYVNLNNIRVAEWDYYNRGNGFIFGEGAALDWLIIENPNAPGHRFSYKVDHLLSPFRVIATRDGGPYDGDYITMGPDGSIDESGWLH